MANIRPKDLPTVTSPTAGDKVIIDGATSRSITFENLQAASTFTQAGTGAVARTVASKLRDVVNAADFGAVFDGLTDDTAAITAAIAATPLGGTLVLPAGYGLISGSGDYIFTISSPINIVGAGSSISGGLGTILLVATGVPSTRDVFHLASLNVLLRGITFRDFGVTIQSGSGGKNVFHFDSTAGTTTGFAEVMLENLVISTNVSAGGYSIRVNNGVGTNTNGGTFNFTVRNCWIGNGVLFTQAGDTLRVYDNIITGPNAGVTVDQVGGAGQVIVSGNNVTSTGGGVIVTQAIAPIITNNQFEQMVASTEANDSMIDLIGSGANIPNAKIVGNQIQSLIGVTTPIRVAAATSTVIDNNRLSGATQHILTTAAADATVVGSGNMYAGAGVDITNGGTNTIYAPLSESPGLSVIGKATAAGGPSTDIVASNVNQALRVSGDGSSIAWGQVQLAGGATSGVTGVLPVANGGTGDSGTAWTVYSPTVTASVGTPTTVTRTGRYKQIGKTVIAQMDITIVNIGTASASLSVTLPVTAAAFKYSGSVFEYSTTGKSGAGYINGTSAPTLLQTRDAAAGSWWVNGYTLAITITYEAA